jgi:hypothetical protein
MSLDCGRMGDDAPAIGAASSARLRSRRGLIPRVLERKLTDQQRMHEPKNAVLAPIPSPRIRTPAIAKPGERRRQRRAYRMAQLFLVALNPA